VEGPESIKLRSPVLYVDMPLIKVKVALIKGEHITRKVRIPHAIL
jgi:hypothetical protein